MSKLWASIDPAKRVTGVALWEGDRLEGTFTIKPRGASGKWYTEDGKVMESEYMAFDYGLTGLHAVIMEEGFGGFAKAVATQGERRGYIRAVCAVNKTPCQTVNVSEWRRCIKEAYGVSWPRESARCKALSVKLVREIHGRDVGDDEADAVLIGAAAMRMRLVDWAESEGE